MYRPCSTEAVFRLLHESDGSARATPVSDVKSNQEGIDGVRGRECHSADNTDVIAHGAC
jgi:hypothetical protein